MTQILAALTHEYVLVASDRRLTVAQGPHRGQIVDDDTCKIVSLCGIWGITYTGLSHLQGAPTHEWIAVRLTENSCRNPFVAAQILANAAVPALRASPLILELTFLVAGWVRLPDRETLQPHFLLITNMHDATGAKCATPGFEFHIFERRLLPHEAYVSRVIGQRLPEGRGKYLDRFFRRLLKHRVGPKPAMQAFVSEIVNNAKQQCTVGSKILAFSISRAAAKRTYETGGSMLLAMEPDLSNVAFCYFDPAYSGLRQYGPTSICGAVAVTVWRLRMILPVTTRAQA